MGWIGARRIRWISGAAGCAFALLAILALTVGQPEEDAYILFKYSHNLASGLGIVFYAGGPPTEGATDFLYMAVVAGVTRLSGDPPISAAIVNGFGVAGIVAAFLTIGARLAPHEGAGARFATIITAAYLTLLAFSSAVLASVAGFGAASDRAIAAWLFVLLHRRDANSLTLVPLVSLLLGLWRPDGIILGGAGTAIALFEARGTAAWPTTARTTLLSVLAGAFYFALRFHYFGEPLPLPLYVKTATSGWFPGLAGEWGHLLKFVPLLVFIGASLYRKFDRRVLLALAPAGALFVALFRIFPSQNIVHRFQAPIDILILLAGYAIAVERFAKTARGAALSVAAMLASTAPLAVQYSGSVWRDLSADDYMLRFPAEFAGLVSSRDTIAITEAGRLPYFASARFIDLTGLNDAYAAIHGTDAERLSRLQPDLLMFHRSGMLELAPQRNFVREIACKSLGPELRPNSVGRATAHAAYASAKFLSRTDAYRCFAVKCRGNTNHLYAVRKAWPKASRFMTLLLAQKDLRMSYFEARALAQQSVERDMR